MSRAATEGPERLKVGICAPKVQKLAITLRSLLALAPLRPLWEFEDVNGTMAHSLLRLFLGLSRVVLVASQAYDDWTWVKKFAAVGDSFTAGIGAGRLHGSDKNTVDCSRYDLSYPVVMQRFLGSVQNFQYPACSGDTSVRIMEQIDQLSGDIDLAVMTAGGNDLCLVSSPSPPHRHAIHLLRGGASVQHYRSVHSQPLRLRRRLPGNH